VVIACALPKWNFGKAGLPDCMTASITNWLMVIGKFTASHPDRIDD
jgi:hypothetical protein